MIILGITDHSTSGAGLVVDGRATAAVNEERLVRSKMIMGFHGDLSRRVYIYIYLFIFCLIELKLENTR
jgi:predicted NodU family carbamoyl transferase